MARQSILLTRRLPPQVEARARASYDVIDNPDDRILTPQELRERAHNGKVAALLVCTSEKVDEALLAQLPDSLKAVATFSVGYDHIDVAACKARGIMATNTPDVLTDSTADIAMLLLLGAARRAYEGDRLVRAGEWKGWHTMMLLGVQPGGKRLGIFGMGRIGQAVAQRARAFGMRIHYHNRSRLAPELEAGAEYHASPESLLRVSDFLCLNAPSSPATRGFLNSERIALLPEGAIVVNTARGDLVVDDDLIAALQSGRVRAAGLDVFANEPALHPGYAGLPNTLLLPHLGSATIETRDAMGFTALDNIDAVLAGRTAPNPLW